MRSYSFEKIFVPVGYSDVPLSQGISINQFILTNSNKGARRAIDDFISRIKNIRRNQLTSIKQDERDEKVQYVYYNELESDFFKKANNQKVPVISFRTKTEFETPVLDIRIEYFDKQGQVKNSTSTVKNISYSSHFDIHRDFFQQIEREQIISDEQWDAAKLPFRLKDRMVSYLLEMDFDNQRNSDTNYRVKFFREIGIYLAELNGWKYEREYSARFNRPVLSSTGKRKLFLSIDLQHPEFELLRHTGKHIMSYCFDGESNGKTYNDRSHDLKF
ncbi:MAG: hypothetical protein ACTHK8_08155 [Ginsengibacter sp.]